MMNKNQHNRRTEALNPGISALEIERKWRRYKEELEMMESARAFQAVVAVASSGGGSQTTTPAESDIVTLTTEINGTFNPTVYSSTGYIGVEWWDSSAPEILGDGIPENQITIPKDNDGTSRNVTFYSCDADGVRIGNINVVDVFSQNLTSLDVTKCLGLTSLSCYQNNLTSLDLSGLTQINYLNCADNFITSLNVSGFELLQTLTFTNNLLTSIDASGCSALSSEFLDFGGNTTLVSLNFSDCTSLTSFLLNNSDLDLLTSVDLSGCTSLDSSSASLNLSSCPSLTSVNLSGCTSLVSLGRLNFRYTSPIQTLNLSNCTSLETFIISDASRTYSFVSLDFSGCSSLLNINLNDESDLFPSLETINVTGCSALTSLSFVNSVVSSIDISDCVLLTFIAGSSSLTALNASGLTALGYVGISNNLFTDTALNSLFTSLETVVSGDIYIVNNPGTATCDPGIVIVKGWTVYN